MEDWIKVFEYSRKEKDTVKWLFDLLENERIPYKEELKNKEWIQGRFVRYSSQVFVYVPKDCKEKVEMYLNEYNNSDNIIYEDIDELKNASNNDEEVKMEQIKREKAKKILPWIPVWFVLLIIILCWLTMK